MGQNDFKSVEMSKLVSDKEMLTKKLDEGLKARDFWDTTIKNISGALTYIEQHIAELKVIIDEGDKINPLLTDKMTISKE